MGVPELVNISPAPTLDGSLLVGSQHTSVFVLDGATGQLLRCAGRRRVPPWGGGGGPLQQASLAR